MKRKNPKKYRLGCPKFLHTLNKVVILAFFHFIWPKRQKLMNKLTEGDIHGKTTQFQLKYFLCQYRRNRLFSFEIYITNYFVGVMDDVILMTLFLKLTLFNFNLIAFGEVLNYTHFSDLLPSNKL